AHRHPPVRHDRRRARRHLARATPRNHLSRTFRTRSHALGRVRPQFLLQPPPATPNPITRLVQGTSTPPQRRLASSPDSTPVAEPELFTHLRRYFLSFFVNGGFFSPPFVLIRAR